MIGLAEIMDKTIVIRHGIKQLSLFQEEDG